MERLWMVPSYMILTLIAIGTLGAFTGAMTPFRGFSLVFLGVVTAVVFGIALAGAAAFASATGKSWRPRALRASVIPLLIAIPAFIAVNLSNVPTMNDVSTDLGDRLEFDPEVTALRTSQEPNPEQRAHFDVLQQQSYPDLVPILVALPPDQAFAQAKQAAESLPGWQVTSADAATGRIEATDTSRIFHFVDDVVIRVRPDAAGSRIDIRSRSRDGLGDLGMNAKRVRAYSEAVKKQGSS
jgi:uncharacterized protein (DUF1499 family)